MSSTEEQPETKPDSASSSSSSSPATSSSPTALPTPAVCIADFCLVPIGTPTPSVAAYIAAVQRHLRSCSGVEFSMHSAGTTVEGPWDLVMTIIGQAHTLVHSMGVGRVQTDIRVGSRTDKKQSFGDKVRAVEDILARDGE